jgi:hypothetical protein
MSDDIMNVLGDVMAFQGQRPGGKGITPLGTVMLSSLWWNVLLFSSVLPPYTHLGDVEEIFNPLGVSLGASES